MDIHQPAADPHAEIREEVRKLCARFPGEYWRELDFVNALTESGYLAALIPEEYGGAGLPLRAASVILEEIHASRLQRGRLPRPDVHHGNAAAARQREAEADVPAEDRHRRIAPPGLRRHASPPPAPTPPSSRPGRSQGDHYVVNGQKIWTSRALYSDLMLLLARTTPADQVKKRADGMSVFIVDMKATLGKGLAITPIPTMINHNTTEVFFDDMKVPAENLIGEEGKGFRYILDGMNAERVLIASEALGDGRWFIEKAVKYANERVVFGAPIGKNQGIQFPIARAYAQLQAAEMMVRRAAALFDDGKEAGADANMSQDAGFRGNLGGGGGLHADLWRLRLRQGIRHRAQVAGMQAVQDGADQHEPDFVVYWRACAGDAAELLSMAPIPVAIAYDFDGTLAPGNMQEHVFLPALDILPGVFWEKTNRLARDQQGDPILTYMHQMLQEARHANLPMRREDWIAHGRDIILFAGVEDWFDRINDASSARGIAVQHFVISSGLRELIEGTPIHRHLAKVFASGFLYDASDVAIAAAIAVNYTTKTQYLFRINKGALDIADNKAVNAYQPHDQRAVPFTNMIFIGDGETDIPCFRLVKEQGGHSIAVYDPEHETGPILGQRLIQEGRVHCAVAADYRGGGELEKRVLAVLDLLQARALVMAPETPRP
jgi:acyl-CoA dehydrogenase